MNHMQIKALSAQDQNWVLQLAHLSQVYCPDCGNEDLAFSAKHEGEPLGYIAWQVVLDEASLLGIAIQPHARRQQIASLLHRHSEQILQAKGVRRLFLELRQSNQGALALYQTLGYEEIGRRHGYYQALPDATNTLKCKEDAIVMRKMI